MTTADRADLDRRLEALGEVLDLADGRLDADLVDRAREVAGRAGERLGLGVDATVAALAGATGSGKSTLFNALAGAELSEAGVRRPTTGETSACVWADGATATGPLLEWLGVRRRHHRPAEDDLDGLVLLDLPDVDSTVAAHREAADRVVDRADLLVWVLDPEKYADAVVHERYLRPLAAHRDVLLVVLNKVDRLDRSGGAAGVEADVRRLLAEDGLGTVPVLATSARSGEGLGHLRVALADRVAARRAAVERLAADLADVAGDLAAGCQGGGRAGRPDRDRLVDALAGAAHVDVVADSVAAAVRFRAAGATGWPFTRWLRRLRPDPLRRLHLGGPADEGERTSLGPASAVQRAAAATAVRDAAEAAGAGLPGPFPALVRRAATAGEDGLADRLDRAVAGTDLGVERRPRWWSAVGLLQVLLAAAVLAGALWLVVLFALAWLQLPDPPLPRWGEVPLPTLLLLGGAAAGLLVAALSRVAARIGARRRARAARRRLRAAVGEVADEHVLAPVAAEVAAHEALCHALDRVLSSSSKRLKAATGGRPRPLRRV